MTEPTFTEIEVRIANHLRVNAETTYTKGDLARVFVETTTRTVDRVLQRMVQLGVLEKTDMRPALYRWAPRRGTDETVRRLVAANVALIDRIS